MCRAENTLKCKDFSSEGQTRKGDSYRGRKTGPSPCGRARGGRGWELARLKLTNTSMSFTWAAAHP